tara:strand:- start:541 stop:1047 length:507 start_codon:yes stop_codon:yes gene_type:complete
MNIKVNIEKNNKDFQILEDNEVVIKGLKPKWYSQQIIFFYNNKTYEIKKKSFWSHSHQILQSGSLIGEIPFSWKNGFDHIHIRQTNKKYWIRAVRTGGMFSSNKTYGLLEDGVKQIIAIHYSWKKWKENIEIEILENKDFSYELIIYGLFLMRQKQQAESSAVAGVYG